MIRQLQAFVAVSFKGGIRDRVLLAILVVGVLLLLSTPVVASFSMRQVVALGASYAISIISLVGLLLTLFLSMTLLVRDLEQRSVYTVCSLPISRSSYLLGKFFGLALLVLAALVILGCFSAVAILVCEQIYPPERPFGWGAFAVNLWFQYWVLLVVAGTMVLFTTVATTPFLPLALTVGLYFASYSTEAVRYFVQTASGQKRLDPLVRLLGRAVYWVLPNFSSFDLKTEVVYGIGLNGRELLTTQAYGVCYLAVLLALATLSFSRREFL